MRNNIFAIFLSTILLSIDLAGFTVSGKITTTADKAVQYASIRFVLMSDTNYYYTALTDTLGDYRITLTSVTEPVSTTESFQLHQNYPNPFSEKTTISYSIKEGSEVTVTIYDILGRKVKSFQQAYMPGGNYSVEWDGRGADGKRAAYGVYFYRIVSNNFTKTKKMVYISPAGLTQYISNRNLPNKTFSENIISGKYKVYIDTTEITTPKIEPVMGDEITIRQDTVVNFRVLDATAGVWHYLGLDGETVTAIAVHPNDPSIIYVGTAFDFSAGHMGKLFKSTDSGKTWDTLMNGPPSFSYYDIKIDPIHPETIYATPFPVIKSTNAGETWFEISNGIRIDWETRASPIVIDPLNTNVLYCGTGGFFGGRMYKSVNGGINWIDITQNDALRNGVISLCMDPNNSNIIYAGTAFSGNLLKTTDAGNTWRVTGLGSTAQLINDILIHPTNSQIIFACISELGIWKSENGGNTWIPYNEGLIDSLKSAMKVIMRRKSSELFLILASQNNPGIYRKYIDDKPWLKIGIANLRSYYYSDIKLSIDENTLYFGSTGLYYYKLK